LNAGAIEVVISEDAIDRLADWVEVCSAPRRAPLVVMDANTREAAGADVVTALRPRGVAVEEFVFGERTGLLAGPAQSEAVQRRLGSGAVAVAVGSGVITDIVRHAAHARDQDFVAVPTAASMDGYASGMAAMQVEGVKVTYPARAPLAIFADPRVAAAAPGELSRAGLGDLLGKATARVDWLLAHLLYGEEFDAAVAERVLGPLRFAAGSAVRVLSGESDGVARLLGGLIESGIAMVLAGSSRPASGCEHHASHFWDLLAARGRRGHASHGLQVGYATRFAMALQRYALGGGSPAAPTPAPPRPWRDPLGSEAQAWLGGPTPEIVAAVEEKQRFLASGRETWPSDAAAWERVRARLEPSLALFDEVSAALDAAEIPAAAGYLEVDDDMLRATFRFANRLRARYTVLDFLEGQDKLEAALDAIGL
jgi:glycerol-1-phosphate dehydrogenase [NAD(P)+]